MSAEDATASCPVWNPSSCVGTTGCPPRCPRFVDKYGDAIHIRPPRDTDRERLLAFYEEYPEEHRSMLLPPRRVRELERWLDRLLERGRNLLAFHGEQLVGHVLYSPQEGPHSELLVFVDENYHSRGIGTELCQQAIAYAADDGHVAITLRVERGNTAAFRVYQRLGFRTVEEHPDNIEMRLDIDQQLAQHVQAPPAERSARFVPEQ